MRSKKEILDILYSVKPELEKKYGVMSMAIFGSYARGDYSPDSDIDILVEFNQPIGLNYFELADYLEQILQCNVDLFTYKAIQQKPKIWESVKEDILNV